MMRGMRLGHVNIRTTDLERTVAFYEMLGLARGPAATMATQEGNAWMFDAQGNACIHINPPRPGGWPPQGSSAFDHVAFNCDDEARMTARLRDAGIPFRRSPLPLGVVQLNLTDPNGVRVELTFGWRNLLRDRI